MKMLKSMVVLMAVFTTQNLWATYDPKATQVSTRSAVSDVQRNDTTGDKTCPYAKATGARLTDNTVASTYGTTNLKTRDFHRGTDSSDNRR